MRLISGLAASCVSQRVYPYKLALVICSGLLPSLMGIAHVAIQFPLYEACKSWFAQRALQTRDNKDLNTLELVTASAVSKMIASTATYPHEVLRSHMHVTGSGPFTGFLQVAKEVGLGIDIIHLCLMQFWTHQGSYSTSTLLNVSDSMSVERVMQ